MEETRNNTAWDNQLKGCVTRTRKSIIGNRKRKATGKQLITDFRSTLEAPVNPALDTDAHLKESTNIHIIGELTFPKPNRIRTQDQGQTDKERNEHGREKKKEDFRRVRWFTQACPPPD